MIVRDMFVSRLPSSVVFAHFQHSQFNLFTMKVISASELRDKGVRLFEACGVPHADAEIVTDELVESSLMGLDSHGIIRFPQYVDALLAGQLKAGGVTTVAKESPTTATVDCGGNFGQVGARKMTDVAIAKAKAANVACVIGVNCGHVGRLGSYPQKVAEQGLFGFSVVNNPVRGHWMLPFGGSEPRLGTNPIAYAAPTSGDPIMLDMSTCVLPEGKIRSLMQQGKQAPLGVLVDSEGNPTTDPSKLYGPPRGALLPLGGEFGYKGFGLGLLVEILGGLLGGYSSAQDHHPHVNGMCLIAINPDAFCGRERFRELVDEMSAYMLSSRPSPGSRGVMMPGGPEFSTKRKRLAEGLPIADETWRLFIEGAKRVDVSIE